MPQYAGEDILASDIWTPRYISKTASESVTSNGTPQNDDDFFVTLPVGLWRVELFMHFLGATSPTLGGLKQQWTTTGTITGIGRTAFGPAFGTGNSPASTNVRTTGHNLSTAVSFGSHASVTGVAHEDLLLNVSVSGVLQLQWAQDTSSATSTTVSTASRMYITQLEAWS